MPDLENPFDDDDVHLLAIDDNEPPDSIREEVERASEIDEAEHNRDLAREAAAIEEADYADDDNIQIFVTEDESGKPCYAMYVTEELAYRQIDFAKADRRLQTKKKTLERVERRLGDWKFQLRSDNSSGSSAAISEQDGEQLDAKPAKPATKKFQKLEDAARLLRKQIGSLEFQIGRHRIAIQQILETAMEGAELQNIPEYQESVSDGETSDEKSEEDPQGDKEPAAPEPKEPEISDEEKAIKEARNNFWQAEQAYMCKLHEFDSMEYYSAMRLRSYEEALENGTAEGRTRSDFDRRDLYAKMWLTASLIGKERERDERREEAEELGAFDDGWGQESYYGYSQATVESLGDGEEPEGGYQIALKPATINFIESWVENCDVANSPDIEMDDIKDDEWDAEPVGFSDSLSVVDFTSNAKNIAKWEYIREEAREDFPDGLGDTEDVDEFDDALDQRERAHSI
ncbi:MAG: hypothetical protein OHK93_000924 [Ramalina farinacea]|uniref:Uncharacterized protein n=1 Tax=Ramalina farinacea TaxID=258253 RepID=A0AA43QNH9_9LECA|nr:hypothetical protein [Ramalina farinacea]